jgi:hypothetical protein
MLEVPQSQPQIRVDLHRFRATMAEAGRYTSNFQWLWALSKIDQKCFESDWARHAAPQAGESQVGN